MPEATVKIIEIRKIRVHLSRDIFAAAAGTGRDLGEIMRPEPAQMTTGIFWGVDGRCHGFQPIPLGYPS